MISLKLWKPRKRSFDFRMASPGPLILDTHFWGRSYLCGATQGPCQLCKIEPVRKHVYLAAEIGMSSFDPVESAKGNLLPAEDRTVLLELSHETWHSVLSAGSPADQTRILRMRQSAAHSAWRAKSANICRSDREEVSAKALISAVNKLYRLPPIDLSFSVAHLVDSMKCRSLLKTAEAVRLPTSELV